MPNQTCQSKPDIANQAYWTKQTKPKLLVKAVYTWVRSAFGNVYYLKHILTKIFTLNSVAPEFLKDQLAEVREVDESSFGNFVGDVHDLLMILIQAMSPNDYNDFLQINIAKPDGSRNQVHSIWLSF